MVRFYGDPKQMAESRSAGLVGFFAGNVVRDEKILLHVLAVQRFKWGRRIMERRKLRK